MVTAREPVPEAGDVVWLDFAPQSGHEQGGRRPAVVLSPASYNGKTGMMVCCPMTSQIKGYPFEVALAEPHGVVLADQVKCMDWRARRAKPRGRVSDTELSQVRAKLGALIGL